MVTKKKKTKQLSFDLTDLLEHEPCAEGLSVALQFLKKHRCIKASPGFWRVANRLARRECMPNGDDPMDELIKRAPGVKIIVRPKIFAKKIMEDHNFREYVFFLAEKNLSTVTKSLYKSFEKKLLKSSENRRKQEIQLKELQLKHIRERLALHQKNLEEIKQSKVEPMSISQFNLNDAMFQRDENYSTLTKKDRQMIAEELARALV